MTQRGKDFLFFGVGLAIALAGLGIQSLSLSGGKLAYLCTIVGIILVFAGATEALNRAFAIAFRRRGDEPAEKQKVHSNPTDFANQG